MNLLFHTTHVIPVSQKYHIYTGSDGIMCLHHRQSVLVEDIVCIGDNFKVRVTEIVEKRKKSITYPKHEFVIFRFIKAD